MNTYYNYFKNSYKDVCFVFRRLSSKAASSFAKSAGSKISQTQKNGARLEKAEELKKSVRSKSDSLDVNARIKAAQRKLEESHAALRKLQELKNRESRKNRESLSPIQQKELNYFLKEGRNPKERYLLYNMLKYGLGKSNMQVEQNWNIFKLKRQFTKQRSKHTGFYYDGNTLVIKHTPKYSSRHKDYSFLVFHSNPSKIRNSGTIEDSPYHSKDSSPGSPGQLKRDMARYLKRFNEYQSDSIDLATIRKRMATRGLQTYVMYRFMESYGCEVDHNWSRQEILDNLAGSGALKRWYTGKARTAKIYRADRDATLKVILKEYVKYSGIGTQVTDAFVVSMRDKILKLSKGFED